MDDAVYAGGLQASPVVAHARDDELAQFLAPVVEWLDTLWINAWQEHWSPALSRNFSYFSVHSAGSGGTSRSGGNAVVQDARGAAQCFDDLGHKRGVEGPDAVVSAIGLA